MNKDTINGSALAAIRLYRRLFAPIEQQSSPRIAVEHKTLRFHYADFADFKKKPSRSRAMQQNQRLMRVRYTRMRR